MSMLLGSLIPTLTKVVGEIPGVVSSFAGKGGAAVGGNMPTSGYQDPIISGPNNSGLGDPTGSDKQRSDVRFKKARTDVETTSLDETQFGVPGIFQDYPVSLTSASSADVISNLDIYEPPSQTWQPGDTNLTFNLVTSRESFANLEYQLRLVTQLSIKCDEATLPPNFVVEGAFFSPEYIFSIFDKGAVNINTGEIAIWGTDFPQQYILSQWAKQVHCSNDAQRAFKYRMRSSAWGSSFTRRGVDCSLIGRTFATVGTTLTIAEVTHLPTPFIFDSTVFVVGGNNAETRLELQTKTDPSFFIYLTGRDTATANTLGIYRFKCTATRFWLQRLQLNSLHYSLELKGKSRTPCFPSFNRAAIINNFVLTRDDQDLGEFKVNIAGKAYPQRIFLLSSVYLSFTRTPATGPTAATVFGPFFGIYPIARISYIKFTGENPRNQLSNTIQGVATSAEHKLFRDHEILMAARFSQSGAQSVGSCSAEGGFSAFPSDCSDLVNFFRSSLTNANLNFNQQSFLERIKLRVYGVPIYPYQGNFETTTTTGTGEVFANIVVLGSNNISAGSCPLPPGCSDFFVVPGAAGTPPTDARRPILYVYTEQPVLASWTALGSAVEAQLGDLTVSDGIPA